MEREKAKTLDVLLDEFLKSQGLEEDIMRIRIFDAWDNAVGPRGAKATSSKSFAGGVLYCTISSSVMRNQLYFQADIILKKINSEIGCEKVAKIVLK